MPSSFGATFKVKEIPYGPSGDERIKMNIWDTAGQERFDSINKMYFRDADAAIVIYDITDTQSFEKADKWVK